MKINFSKLKETSIKLIESVELKNIKYIILKN